MSKFDIGVFHRNVHVAEEPDIEAALASYMAEENIDRAEALRRVVRDWLVGHGYLPLAEPAPMGVNIVDKG